MSASFHKICPFLALITCGNCLVGYVPKLFDSQEAEVFKQLVLSDTAKGLVHVFFAQRATSKVRLAYVVFVSSSTSSFHFQCSS